MENYSQTTARIGDGTDPATVKSQGGISVSSNVSDNPTIQAQTSVEDDKEATKKPSTQVGFAFAVSVDITRDDAYAYIAGNTTVNAREASRSMRSR